MARMSDLSLLERVNYNGCLVSARNRRLEREEVNKTKSICNSNNRGLLLGTRSDCTSLDFTKESRKESTHNSKTSSFLHLAYKKLSHFLMKKVNLGDDLFLTVAELMEVSIGCSAFFLGVILLEVFLPW